MDESMKDFEPLLEIILPCSEFLADWSHCDRMATYLARQVSFARSDPEYFSNLLSSALNELLEAVFRARPESGQLRCCLSRAGSIDRIAISLPCEEAIEAFFRGSIDAASGAGAMEHYEAALLAQGTLDPAIGLFELALDYGAQFRFGRESDGQILLTADLVLEDLS
jgi:hypothetical protein